VLRRYTRDSSADSARSAEGAIRSPMPLAGILQLRLPADIGLSRYINSDLGAIGPFEAAGRLDAERDLRRQAPPPSVTRHWRN